MKEVDSMLLADAMLNELKAPEFQTEEEVRAFFKVGNFEGILREYTQEELDFLADYYVQRYLGKEVVYVVVFEGVPSVSWDRVETTTEVLGACRSWMASVFLSRPGVRGGCQCCVVHRCVLGGGR